MDEASDQASLVGVLLGDRYQIVRLLGVGGMGAVYAARDEGLERDVAVKVLNPEFAGNREAQSRLLREAQILAQLKHPNLVVVHDTGRYQGRQYFVQELLEGHTLAAEGNIWPGAPRHVLRRVMPALSALAEAHRAGVIHRDVKPQNIVLSRTRFGEVPKVLDFGIAKYTEVDPSRTALTRPFALMGTAQYMSPEQAEGASDIDARSDVWSMGVVIYEGLTCRPMWGEKKTGPAVLVAVTREPIRDLREAARWTITADFAAVVARSLERDRSKRFRDCGEMKAAVEASGLSTLWQQVWGCHQRPARKGEIPREDRFEAYWYDQVKRGLVDEATAATAVGVGRWMRWADESGVPDRVADAVRGALERGCDGWKSDCRGWENVVKVQLDAESPKDLIQSLEAVGFKQINRVVWAWVGKPVDVRT